MVEKNLHILKIVKPWIQNLAIERRRFMDLTLIFSLNIKSVASLKAAISTKHSRKKTTKIGVNYLYKSEGEIEEHSYDVYPPN